MSLPFSVALVASSQAEIKAKTCPYVLLLIVFTPALSIVGLTSARSSSILLRPKALATAIFALDTCSVLAEIETLLSATTTPACIAAIADKGVMVKLTVCP